MELCLDSSCFIRFGVLDNGSIHIHIGYYALVFWRLHASKNPNKSGNWSSAGPSMAAIDDGDSQTLVWEPSSGPPWWVLTIGSGRASACGRLARHLNKASLPLIVGLLRRIGENVITTVGRLSRSPAPSSPKIIPINIERVSVPLFLQSGPVSTSGRDFIK